MRVVLPRFVACALVLGGCGAGEPESSLRITVSEGNGGGQAAVGTGQGGMGAAGASVAGQGGVGNAAGGAGQGASGGAGQAGAGAGGKVGGAGQGNGGVGGAGQGGQGDAGGAGQASAGAGGSTQGAGGAGQSGAGQAGAGQSGAGQAGAGQSGAGAGGAGAGAGAGAAGAAGQAGAADAGGVTRYGAGVRHGPMSPGVVKRLGKVLASSSGRKDVFAKVGDSITVSGSFLHCFAGSDVKFGAHGALGPTREWFRATKAAGQDTSFDRDSLAAAVGWGAFKTVEGAPSPIEQEVAAVSPAFAVVMLGTNDTYEQGVVGFDRSLLEAVDLLLSSGVVPLVSTIPPRADKATADALVPEMNAIVRAIAQQRQVPYLDLWQLLEALSDKGLVGDGIHLSSYASGGVHACWLTPEGLGEGMNVRNLITLEALDRARRFLIEGEAPEATPPGLEGKGTWADPYVVDALPFVDHGDTSKLGPGVVSKYSCATADEGGPEVVYRVKLAKATTISARVFDGQGVDVDVHGLTAPDAGACVDRDDKRIVVEAGPGDFYVVVDTYVSGGQAQAGPFRLTIVPVP